MEKLIWLVIGFLISKKYSLVIRPKKKQYDHCRPFLEITIGLYCSRFLSKGKKVKVYPVGPAIFYEEQLFIHLFFLRFFADRCKAIPIPRALSDHRVADKLDSLYECLRQVPPILLADMGGLQPEKLRQELHRLGYPKKSGAHNGLVQNTPVCTGLQTSPCRRPVGRFPVSFFCR